MLLISIEGNLQCIPDFFPGMTFDVLDGLRIARFQQCRSRHLVERYIRRAAVVVFDTDNQFGDAFMSVSYTHLTLPTKA